MTDQTIVAVYDTPAHAELAVQDLLQSKVPESAIHRHSQEGSYAGSATTATTRTEEPGFWASLFGGEPDHDTAVYDRSVSSGSNAVSVKVPDDHVATVMDILERHNPIDIDERAGSYGLAQTTTVQPLAAPTPLVAPKVSTDSGETVQLSEEHLAVGKRVVNRGGTRIRRFVVETPAEESVTLRDEKVTLERRPVTDARLGNASFTEKTIEMTESAEEAVVSKTARVYEEVGLKKNVTDRVEKVSDTVRREEVEIEQIPGTTTTTTTTGTSVPSTPKT